MRKLAVIATGAVAVVFGVVAVAYAANVYTVTQARVTPANAGTTSNPTPIRVEFGYTVTESTGVRPSVTTDYIIGFGPRIRSNYLLRDSRTRRIAFEQCNLNQGSTNTCPVNSKLGTGIVNNLAGVSTDPNSKIPCRLNLTTYAGTGQTFPPAQNDGKVVRANFWISLVGGPTTTGCPLNVNAALPAQFVRYRGGTALTFHVPRVPFQQPQQGIDNAVVEVTSSNYELKRVNKRFRVRRGNRFVFVHRLVRRGYFESTGCPRGGHPVEVQFTSQNGQVSTAAKRAPCTP